MSASPPDMSSLQNQIQALQAIEQIRTAQNTGKQYSLTHKVVVWVVIVIVSILVLLVMMVLNVRGRFAQFIRDMGAGAFTVAFVYQYPAFKFLFNNKYTAVNVINAYYSVLSKAWTLSDDFVKVCGDGDSDKALKVFIGLGDRSINGGVFGYSEQGCGGTGCSLDQIRLHFCNQATIGECTETPLKQPCPNNDSSNEADFWQRWGLPILGMGIPLLLHLGAATPGGVSATGEVIEASAGLSGGVLMGIGAAAVGLMSLIGYFTSSSSSSSQQKQNIIDNIRRAAAADSRGSRASSPLGGCPHQEHNNE